MVICFSKSKMPLSKLIRWLSGDPVSHVIIVFDEKFAIHSNLYGVHLDWFNSLEKHVDIVYKLEYKLSLKREEEVYRSLLDNFDGRSYDWPAFFYLLWRGLLWKFLKKPLPSKNPWNEKDGYLCTEIAGCLPKWLTGLETTDYSLVTPYKLYEMLKRDKT